jgi:hypothetical protein
MNSTIIYVGLAYLAGIGTYELFETRDITSKLDTITTEVMMDDSMKVDTSVAAYASSTCACENEHRYDVVRPTSSENFPIPHVDQCQLMVHAANPGELMLAPVHGSAKSPWILCSAIRLTPMESTFTKHWMVKDVTYIIEAARKDDILTTDDGLSYIYYSRTMCPTDWRRLRNVIAIEARVRCQTILSDNYLEDEDY